MKKVIGLVFALALISLPAHAWNCTQAGQIRVQVPTGTVGSGQGDGPGQVDTVEGITFQCQTPPTPSTTPAGGNSNATNSSTSSNQSSSNANSTSGASSTSNSTSGSQS